MTPRIVLASASPRRAELLRTIIPRFEVIPSDIDESIDDGVHVVDAAKRLAVAKAEEVGSRASDAIVIGADTLVVIDECALGKPIDTDDARRMLRLLSGRTHNVVTGLSVRRGNDMETAAEVTEVSFAPISADQMDAYILTGEPFDKAGAYGIQGRASTFIKGVTGCYFNVVGLPLYLLGTMLRRQGILVEEMWRENGRV